MPPESPARLSGISKGARMVRMRSRSSFRCALLAAVAANTLVPASPVLAQDQRRAEYRIEAGDLGEALKAVSRQSGKEIIFTSEAVLGLKAPALHGSYSADEVVRALLAGSGLVAQYRRNVIIIRGRPKPPRDLADRSAEQTDIVVTGSHIRGSAAVSPPIVTTRTEIESRGISDLGTFARSLVQNYSGGQNPGIAVGAQGTSENLTSSSALNLRGLGADATLTLFNGHRVAYDAISQGVDISAVPLAAIERVEIVTDGSSALYGSDAVGGVANVILRDDFDGVAISGRVGGATDGGDFEHQYNLVSGKRWANGSIMAAFDFRDTTPITAGQRSYTQTNNPADTLQSGGRQYSVVVAGHQTIAEGVSFEVDGQFSDRDSRICVSYVLSDTCRISGADIAIGTRSWTMAPSIKLDIGRDWQLRLTSLVGESRAKLLADVSFDGALEFVQKGVYTNRVRGLEGSADGPLFRLPGGQARLAAGGGFRTTTFDIDVAAIQQGIAAPYLDFAQSRTVSYGYGEVSLPFISPSNKIALVHRFNVTAAIRYEDVSHVGGVATPKVSAIYAPSGDVAFKFSWGKSFKAPTQFQSGQPRLAYSQVGDTGYFPPSPIGGSVLYLVGGNSALRPERATSWTAATTLTPSFLDGLRVEVSYFQIRYRDRVVSPIPQNSLAFAPVYGAYVNFNPTRDQILSALSGVSTVYEQGGGDPRTSNVVAIITNYLQNAAVQRIEGLDIAANYQLALANGDKLHLSSSASYLKSEQQLSAGQPTVALAGTLYRPPHWRASSQLEWQHGQFSLSGVHSYIGGSIDSRIEPAVKVGSYQSFDLIGRIATPDGTGALSNLTISVSALNVFNQKPPYIRTTSPLGYHYDSNNFPSIGRFLSLSVSKTF